MQVTEVLARLGGVADAGSLVSATSRKRVRIAVERGQIQRVGRGYALPSASDGRRAAQALSGVMSGLSAAAYWGWELKHQAPRPHVTVPYKRKVAPVRRAGIDVRWRDLPRGDIYADLVTRPAATVIECALTLPFDEALAVADSALRHDDIGRDELVRRAERLTRGRTRALRVAEAADVRSANPFESVLRAISLEVSGLQLEPQVEIDEAGYQCRVDLADRERRIAVEADSFEFHGMRSGLVRDCRRYTALALRGWRVIRFSWEDVMLHPAYVREALRALSTGPGPEQQVLLRPAHRKAG